MSRRELLISACLAGVLLAALTPNWLLTGADGIPATSPLFGNFGSHAAVADSQLLVWILAWDAHALVTQPLSFFDANIFYPAGRMLTGSEALVTSALLALPLNLLTGNAVLAANFAAWCSYWLALVLTWVLLRGCGRSMLASALGAVIFCLAPFLVPETLRILQLPHWMLPAVILAVRPRAGGGAALRAFLVTLFAFFGSYYIAAMTLVVLAVEFLLICLAKEIGRGLRMAAAVIPHLPAGPRDETILARFLGQNDHHFSAIPAFLLSCLAVVAAASAHAADERVAARAAVEVRRRAGTTEREPGPDEVGSAVGGRRVGETNLDLLSSVALVEILPAYFGGTKEHYS